MFILLPLMMMMMRIVCSDAVSTHSKKWNEIKGMRIMIILLAILLWDDKDERNVITYSFLINYYVASSPLWSCDFFSHHLLIFSDRDFLWSLFCFTSLVSEKRFVFIFTYSASLSSVSPEKGKRWSGKRVKRGDEPSYRSSLFTINPPPILILERTKNDSIFWSVEHEMLCNMMFHVDNDDHPIFWMLNEWINPLLLGW